MEVTFLSRDTIKPSSPTPLTFESFHLLCMEETSPLVYTPLFLFYPRISNDDDSGEYNPEIDTLKNSLSESINRFLFLEGEIVGESIRCNYEEIIFVKAKVTGKISEIFVGSNNDTSLMKLVMYSTFNTDPDDKYALIGVQANIVECGGVVISLCLLHEVIDPTTLSHFLRSWFDINTSSFNCLPSMACSDFGPLFPLFDPQQKQVLLSSNNNSQQKASFQSLVFKDDEIPILKDKAKSSDVQNPTCVEVLLGSLWKCILEVVLLQSTTNSDRPSILTHAIINLNTKMLSSNSLPRSFSVGNFWWIEVADHYVENEKTQMELSNLVGFLRESFQEMNGDSYSWLKSLVGNQRDRVISKLLSAEIIPKLYICTNWENIDQLNEFGWGNTIWIESDTTSKNIGILLRTIRDNEIEIWMVLDEEEIELLVQNEEFCGFVNLTFP